MSVKAAFFGTAEISAVCLDRLIADGHTIAAIITQPDRPAGRGNKLTPPAVKQRFGDSYEILQPESVRDSGIINLLTERKPDIIIAVAYGKILPKAVLDIPAMGAVNIHTSLLPKYRGAAPVQRAIMAGETITGVTSMYMSEGMDEGDIILARETEILPGETYGQLLDRLSAIGADVLSETVKRIESGSAPRTPQNSALATYAPPILKSEARIDWNLSAKDIVNLIRGTNPNPAATAEINGQFFKVFSAVVSSGHGKPGEVLQGENGGITVACVGGAVTLTEIAAAGGKRMTASEYLRGHKL